MQDPNDIFKISPAEFKKNFDRIYEIRRKQILQYAEAKKRERDIDERKLKDTKPLFVKKWVGDRFVMVVGGGGMWREDMKDLGERLLEKPNPAYDGREKRDVKSDLDIAIDRAKRRQKGTAVFHIEKKDY